MSIWSFFGKLRLKFFRLLFGRDLFIHVTESDKNFVELKNILDNRFDKLEQDISAFSSSVTDKYVEKTDLLQIVSKYEAVDINTEEDFALAENIGREYWKLN